MILEAMSSGLNAPSRLSQEKQVLGDGPFYASMQSTTPSPSMPQPGPTLEPGLVLGLGKVQPERATWGRPLVGLPPAGGTTRGRCKVVQGEVEDMSKLNMRG